MKIQNIVQSLGGELVGSADMEIVQVAPLSRATSSEIGFVSHKKYVKELAGTSAGAVILTPELKDATSLTRIIVNDPYLYFARLTLLLNPVVKPSPGVHASAVIHSSIPDSSFVGAFVFIGKNCKIGERVVLQPNCVIQDGVEIGDDSFVYPNVTLYSESKIGQRCILHSGCVIGSDGFGYARARDGAWIKIPQIGRVCIGDDVEIGANTTVDRGALDDTVIENGVKLDNLIQIAHNCRVGENSAMAGQSGMAGSASLGKRTMVGGQAGIMGHIDVCNDVVVSARSFASKSITSSGIYTSAIPSQPHKEWLRNAVHFKSLDEMTERLRVLENKIKILENSK